MELNEKYYKDYTYEELVKIGKKIGFRRVGIVLVAIWFFFVLIASTEDPIFAKQVGILIIITCIPCCLFANTVGSIFYGKELLNQLYVEQAIKYIDLGQKIW